MAPRQTSPAAEEYLYINRWGEKAREIIQTD
jgi:hypothetical protein